LTIRAIAAPSAARSATAAVFFFVCHETKHQRYEKMPFSRDVFKRNTSIKKSIFSYLQKNV